MKSDAAMNGTYAKLVALTAVLVVSLSPASLKEASVDLKGLI